MKIPATTAARANLNHWKAGQGDRIRAKRSHEIYRACEFMAQQWSPVRDPLVLKTDPPEKGGPSEMEVCVKRAVSQERYKLHGPLVGVSADVLWDQISAICQRWNLTMKREDWESSTKGDERKAA
jgi:hypothetical protein